MSARPGRLTLDRVAAEASVSKGGLLYHFPDRNSLLTALVRRHVEAFEQSIAHPDDAVWARRYVAATQAGAGLDRALLSVGEEDVALLDPLRERMDAWHARARRHPGLLAVLLAADALWCARLLGLPAPDVDLDRELERVLVAR